MPVEDRTRSPSARAPTAAPVGGGAAASLDLAGAWRLLARSHRARVAYSRGALPALTVVPALLEGACLVLVVRSGSPLAGHGGGVLAVQVDDERSAPTAGHLRWSVTLVGRGEPFSGATAALMAALEAQDTHLLPGDTFVRVHADVVESQLLDDLPTSDLRAGADRTADA